MNSKIIHKKGIDLAMMKRFLLSFCIISFTLLFAGETRAEILFQELFNDTNMSARGWYDNTAVQLSTSEHIPGSTSSVEYHFTLNAPAPEVSNSAIRKKFTDTDSVYVGYYVKHSANWVGSDLPYHPHEIMIMTNLDGDYWGPSTSHLTAYIEENNGRPVLAIQDVLNIDQTNIGQDLTAITEQRAVAGCNGYSQADGSGPEDCYLAGSSYRNDKTWRTGSAYFQDTAGPYYKGDWHHVEAYFQLNSISNNIGVADGILQYWYDGVLIINHTNVLFRTGQYPLMRFNQFLIAPWIGDGSPVDQTLWIDDLTVATSRPVSSYACSDTLDNDGDGLIDMNDPGCSSASDNDETDAPQPPQTCTSFTYSAWGACQPGNTQTRTVLSSSPNGCTGGSPITTQTCTYIPPTAQNSPPSAPSLVSPANGATGSGATVELRWKKSTDPDGDVITYQLNNCTDQSFSGCTPVAIAKNSSALFYAGGAGFFMIGMTVISGLTGRRRIVTLLVIVVLLAGGALLSCGTGGDSTLTPASDPLPADEMNHSISTLTPGTTYYWKVVADDGKGGTADSAVWSYRTQ